jgi:hypothetical protein
VVVPGYGSGQGGGELAVGGARVTRRSARPGARSYVRDPRVSGRGSCGQGSLRPAAARAPTRRGGSCGFAGARAALRLLSDVSATTPGPPSGAGAPTYRSGRRTHHRPVGAGGWCANVPIRYARAPPPRRSGGLVRLCRSAGQAGRDGRGPCSAVLAPRWLVRGCRSVRAGPRLPVRAGWSAAAGRRGLVRGCRSARAGPRLPVRAGGPRSSARGSRAGGRRAAPADPGQPIRRQPIRGGFPTGGRGGRGPRPPARGRSGRRAGAGLPGRGA